MLENVIYLELLRRGYDVYVGKLDNAEIDFIAVKQENKVYIQAAQKIGSPETERREYGRLLDIRIITPNMYCKQMLLRVVTTKGLRPCTLQISC